MGTPAEKWEALDQLAGFQNELATMRKVLEEVKYELLTVKKENEEQKRRILELEDRVDYQDNQSRRDNLVIRGIPESKGETREECAEEIVRLGQQIGVELARSDFTRAHRVPCKTGPRPIIAKFTSSRKREEMLKEKKYLRGTDIFVMEDFSQRVAEQRKVLYDEAKKKWTKGEWACVRFNKLYTNNGVFKWNAMEGHLVQVGEQSLRDNTEVKEEDLKMVLKKLDNIGMDLTGMRKDVGNMKVKLDEETFGKKTKEKTYGN